MSLGKIVVSKEKKVSADVIFDKERGVSFNLNYLSKPELTSLLGRFAKQVTNRKTRQIEQEIDSEKLSAEIRSCYVNGWKGVTYEWLADQFPIELNGLNPKEEIPFNQENLQVLSENIYDFDGWLLEAIKDGSNFRAVKKEDEAKN